MLTFVTAAGLPDGFYPATLTGLEIKESETGEYRRWIFSVEHDGETVEQYANSSLALGPRAKSHAWATALLSRKPQPGETVELIGRKCTLQIEADEESGYSRVAAVLPLMQQPSSSTVNLDRIDEKVYSPKVDF